MLEAEKAGTPMEVTKKAVSKALIKAQLLVR